MNIKRLILLVVVVVGGVLLVLGLLFYFLAPNRLNILIVGSDQRGTEQARSDVLMVFSVPKSPAKPISLITIPRDTRVPIKDHGVDKINHAYALGEREEGSILGDVDLTKATVESFLGIKVHGTVEFTFVGFQEVVDLMGGVDGMNGADLLKIVRNRYRPGGDFARTADQRKVFLNLFTKLKNKDEAIKVYNFVNKSPQTRIRLDRGKLVHFGVVTLIRRGGKLKLDNLKEEFIPGEGQTIDGIYYWIPDEKGKNELVEKHLK